MSIQEDLPLYHTDECAICLEEISYSISFQCHSQKLCYTCYHTYVQTQVTSLSYVPGNNIQCPICESNKIPLNKVLEQLEGEEKQNIDKLIFTCYLRKTGDVERCPLSTCTFAYLPEKCIFKKQTSCPMCYTDLSRPFSLSLTPLITFIYITFMTNNCPRCDIPIDRISGCYHMTCSCSHQFCWYCLKDYKFSQTSRYKAHNQKDCLFLLLIKVIVGFFFAFSLVLAYSGNESFSLIISSMAKLCLGALRALAIDGAIVIQVIVLNHNMHRRNNVRKLGLLFLVMDLLALIVIFLIGDLVLTIYIIGVSLMFAGIVAVIGILVQYSVNTWFNYVR